MIHSLSNIRTTIFAAAVLSLLGPNIRAQVQSPKATAVTPGLHGVRVIDAVPISGDTIWRIRYEVNNPSVRYGTIHGVYIDVGNPKAMGSHALVGKNIEVLGDGTVTPAAVKSHVAIDASGPKVWYIASNPRGIIVWHGDENAAGKSYIIAPRTRLDGFELVETGVPMLRNAWTEPYTPLGVSNEGDPADSSVAEIIRPGKYPKGLFGGVNDTTVVVGPGIARSGVTSALVVSQFQLACKAKLIAETSCSSLHALVGAHTSASAIAKQARNLVTAGPSGTVHSYVTATILQQLRVLGF